jgi:hypothetical protein
VLRKRPACGVACVPFSLAYALASIAGVPIPESSLCFFLWHQRKKRVGTSTQNEILPCFEVSLILHIFRQPC